MPKESFPLTPEERLAQRICKSAGAPGSKGFAAIVAYYRQQSSFAAVKAALDLAVAKQWLLFDSETYTLTKAGLELGSPRSRPKKRRLLPF
jgi:hypothetical protein